MVLRVYGGAWSWGRPGMGLLNRGFDGRCGASREVSRAEVAVALKAWGVEGMQAGSNTHHQPESVAFKFCCAPIPVTCTTPR